MELITINVTGGAPMKIDTEMLQRQREKHDAIAKASFLKGMQKKARPLPAPPQPEPDARPMVTLRELAVRLKMDRSACRRYVLKLGFAPVRQRTADSGYQAALTFTAQQPDAIFAKRSSEGYC